MDDQRPQSTRGIGVFSETIHVVDCLVDLGLGAVGIRAEVEDCENRLAKLDEADEVLPWSDVNAANDTSDEMLHQLERVDTTVFDDASRGVDQKANVPVLTSCRATDNQGMRYILSSLCTISSSSIRDFAYDQ